MNVVIVGAKDRNTEEDKELVHRLMDAAAKHYPNCVFVTMLTHVGVGKFVKEHCLEKGPHNGFRYQLIECAMRLFAQRFSKNELSAIYIARNATVHELGDVFYYFACPERRGTMEELIERAERDGRPCRVMLPGEDFQLL